MDCVDTTLDKYNANYVIQSEETRIPPGGCFVTVVDFRISEENAAEQERVRKKRCFK